MLTDISRKHRGDVIPLRILDKYEEIDEYEEMATREQHWNGGNTSEQNLSVEASG